MGRTNEIHWHFNDYPTCNDQVLAITTAGDLIIAEWDVDEHVWHDIGNDYDWFTTGMVCWTYIPHIPETRTEMPPYREVRNG